MGEFMSFISNNFADFWSYTGFANAGYEHFIMILVGLFFSFLQSRKILSLCFSYLSVLVF
jgi:oxaloacetate decarboxylase beta subunit